MISTNVDEVIALLNGYVVRMRDMRPVMQRIGEYQGSKILLALMDEKDDPEGHAWAAWMPTTREDRARKGNIAQGLLWDEGTLLHSIKVQPSLNQVVIGTDTPYAGYLQEGTPKMAARPFFGWSDEDSLYAEHLIALHIEGALA